MGKATNDGSDAGSIANFRDMGEPRGKANDRTEEIDCFPSVEQHSALVHRQTQMCFVSGLDSGNRKCKPGFTIHIDDPGQEVRVITIDVKISAGIFQ